MTEGKHEIDNIGKSERVVAAILEELYSRGLQNGELNYEDLGLGEEFKPFFNRSLGWLVNEGLIRGEISSPTLGDEPQMAIDPELTSRGFAMLNQKFTVGEREITGVEAVKEASSGSPDWTGPGQFLGGLFGSFTKSIG